MTGKKALEYLYGVNAKQNNGYGDLWFDMIIEAIERDLKVLDTLKKRIVISNMGDTDELYICFGSYISNNDPDCIEDFNLIAITVNDRLDR